MESKEFNESKIIENEDISSASNIILNKINSGEPKFLEYQNLVEEIIYEICVEQKNYINVLIDRIIDKFWNTNKKILIIFNNLDSQYLEKIKKKNL